MSVRLRQSAALLLVALLAAYILAGYAASTWTAPAPLHRSLETSGHEVRTVTGTFAAAILAAPEPAEWIVVMDGLVIHPRERALLEAHVSAGAELWVVSNDPSGLGAWDGLQVDVYPGHVYSDTGGAAQLVTAQGTEFQASGISALLLADGWTPLIETAPLSFRDTNGNGRLDAGEPAGPFVVAAMRPVGEGRVVVIAAGPGFEPPSIVWQELAASIPAGTAITLRYDNSLGAWARPIQSANVIAALVAMKHPVALLGLAAMVAAGVAFTSGQAPGGAQTHVPPWEDAVARYRAGHANAPVAKTQISDSRGKDP